MLTAAIGRDFVSASGPAQGRSLVKTVSGDVDRKGRRVQGLNDTLRISFTCAAVVPARGAKAGLTLGS